MEMRDATATTPGAATRPRGRHAAVLVLAGWLAACSAAEPAPASRADPQALAASGAAGRPADAGTVDSCAAPPAPGRAQYIVGYGSLMQDESRRRTSPRAGPAHPVEVRGYRRGWFARGESVGPGTTYLGVVPDGQGRINAVIYQVDAAELAATDRRELGYCRALVAAENLTSLETAFAPVRGAPVWIYVSTPRSVAVPDARYPIVQSYVDIFVGGCLEQQQRFGLPAFAEQCLSTTADWSRHWVNDRLYPRRPFIFQPRADQIDRLLSTHLREYFSQIRIEGGG